MKDTIYVETTIPSFYHETRPEPEMVARRRWTREWWEVAQSRADLVTSATVLGGVGAGRLPRSFRMPCAYRSSAASRDRLGRA